MDQRTPLSLKFQRFFNFYFSFLLIQNGSKKQFTQSDWEKKEKEFLVCHIAMNGQRKE